ncbi:TPR repeat-containing protein DDB_G0287407-like [Gigantopelta aegis]|uniref:TPR repeat-containing protein DDB_G0287407-like n=1 Tax=Gigantopelta aegis TaxID=1735272 RepID=UPI001B889400|nr:TPR repeat-containing protein DDB_G0287407-like [Gigantopelta aegis]
MEEEREELTRKYFPQIRHLCNERGIHFVPVDMRWGITKESAQNGQVLNICLREIDRSDIFVGFFGQRYGWHSAHGASHGLLEKNFDNAVINYPWVEDYWDRSMTEVEFHHGHLNNPGEMPTIICFRAKKFDDDKYKQYMELGKESMALKYLSESVEAAQQMDSLKTEVKETKDKCLAIDMEYKHPHEFAELIFETLSKYLNEILKPQTELSPRAEMLVDHDNLMMSTRRVYVGGDNYFQQLDDHRKHDKHVFLSGPAGSGKSALLSNWVEHLNETEEELIVIYHFIGCGGNSSKPLNISLRLRLEAQHALQMIKDKKEVQEVSEDKSEDEKSAGKTSDIDKPSADSVRENLNQFRKAVEEIMSDPDRKLVIIVDAIEKAVDDSGKVTKPLYWLPDKLPPGVFIVASSLDTNKIAQEELVDKRQYQTLQMQPLSQDMKHEICVKILQKRGKEFSTEQLQKVVSSKLTANPLFLVITIHELSVFGYFRKLDQKIESLLACESIQQLLNKYLDRMEEDYNVQEYPDNLVKTVFSALFVAHVGLTESELQEAFHIPKPVFSPLYFAMERFIVSHTGPIWFAFSELRDAIEERYLQTEEDRLVITRKLINFFEEKRKGFSITMDYLNTSTIRPAYELPWLQKSIDDKEGLARTLTDLFIFSRLYQERDYELLDLWKSTGYSFIQYGEMFEKEFDTRLVEYYMLYNDGAASSNKPPGVAMLIFLEQMQDFFELAVCKLASMQMSNRIIGILNNVENVDNYEEQSRQKKLANHKYQLACSYCDTERYADGKKLHYETLEYYKNFIMFCVTDHVRLLCQVTYFSQSYGH